MIDLYSIVTNDLVIHHKKIFTHFYRINYCASLGKFYFPDFYKELFFPCSLSIIDMQ